MRTIALLVTLALAGTAAAQEHDPEKAKAAFEAARAAFERGDFRTSVDKLREAFRWYPDPNIQVSIAKRLLDLDEPEEALAELERIETRDRRLRRAVRAEIESVREVLAQPLLVTLETDPPGATLTVDGVEHKAPFRRSLPRGLLKVSVSKEGYDPVLGETIVLRGTRPISRSWTLRPVQGTLTVEVTGIPADARPEVTLNGEPIEPGVPTSVKPGPQVVTCAMPMQPVTTMRTTIAPGQSGVLKCVVTLPAEPPKVTATWKKPVGWSSVSAGAAAVAASIGLFASYADDRASYAEPQYTITGSSKPWVGGVAAGLGATLIGLGTWWLVSD